jgi:hypothetical protein
VRRSLRTGELAYYVCAGPAGLPLALLVPPVALVVVATPPAGPLAPATTDGKPPSSHEV